MRLLTRLAGVLLVAVGVVPLLGYFAYVFYQLSDSSFKSQIPSIPVSFLWLVGGTVWLFLFLVFAGHVWSLNDR